MANDPSCEALELIRLKYGDQHPLATSINHLLTDAAANQTAVINRLHKKQHIRLTPLSLLYDIITRGGTTTQTELADYFPYTKQAMTQALNYLEENELVKRTLDPSDRRIKNISITQKGLALAEESMEVRQAFYLEFERLFSTEEAEMLTHLLERLNTFYKKYDK